MTPPLLALVLAAAVAAAGCTAPAPTQPSAPPTPAAVAEPAPPPAPTSWTVSGRVTSGPTGAPVAGATASYEGLDPVTSDASGAYALVTTEAATKHLTVSAPGFMTRETRLRGGEERTVNLDLIPTTGPLDIYRDMVRGAKDLAYIQPVARWTKPPNFYIRTTWDSGQPVDSIALDYLAGEIRRVIPQLTGGTLVAGTIEMGPSPRPATLDWINITFNPSGNYGRRGYDVNPGYVQFAGMSPCSSAAVIHEIGHAMGYWHHKATPSAMGGGYSACGSQNLTDAEAEVARIAYRARPATSIRTPTRRIVSSRWAGPAAAPPSGRRGTATTTCQQSSKERGYRDRRDSSVGRAARIASPTTCRLRALTASRLSLRVCQAG